MVLQFSEESGGRVYKAALHTVMFMLAGVCKGSHVTLEVRQPVSESEVLRTTFRSQFRCKSNCEVLAGRLTVLEVHSCFLYDACWHMVQHLSMHHLCAHQADAWYCAK